jgi:hypothetical protein
MLVGRSPLKSFRQSGEPDAAAELRIRAERRMGDAPRETELQVGAGGIGKSGVGSANPTQRPTPSGNNQRSIKQISKSCGCQASLNHRAAGFGMGAAGASTLHACVTALSPLPSLPRAIPVENPPFRRGHRVARGAYNPLSRSLA